MTKMTLKALRINAGLKLEDVARTMNVSRATIANWERGRTYPDLKQLGKLAEVYGCGLDDIAIPKN